MVLVSGAICSGKSALVRQLQERHHAAVIKTKDLIIRHTSGRKLDRRALQRAGERLDKADGGEWVAAALGREIDASPERSTPTGLYVVDSVRIEGQVEAIRRAYGAEVFHIHLTADPEILRKRYVERARADDAGVEYDALKRSRTERSIDALARLAVTCSPFLLHS